jgi:SAM-dependent methyltransferase
MNLPDLESLGDEPLDTAASIDAMTRALCHTELFDPLKRMALVDMDLELPGDSVDDDVDQYFQGAEVRNVGYWREGVHTPKQAACGLIHELASTAFDRKQEGPAVSALVVGPNADGIAVELLRLREDARVTVLVFDTASAQRAQVCEPRAKVVRSRRRRFKLADATFDVVLWVEGPGWPERVSSLREIHRVLKPGGVLAGADLLVRQTEPDLNPDEGVDAIAAYERALRGAGLVDVEVLDVTDKTWRPFFEHSRRYFRVKHLFDQIDRDRYQQTFEALPAGDQPVVAYVMVLASREASR